MRISVVCPSEIAYRRFMPAIKKSSFFEYAGVGYHSTNECFGALDNTEEIVDVSRTKAKKFRSDFGGTVYDSYEEVILDKEVEAIYIPLPPIFHYAYAKKAINHSKHVFLEKPACFSLKEMDDLLFVAKSKELAVHENFMFMYHSQLNSIQRLIVSDIIGKVRLFRISFGFPFRGSNDFRYNKKLGGGALADAGCYTLKLASYLLGKTCKIESAVACYEKEFEVDISGHGILTNKLNQVVELSYGMDNDYKCDLEVWGSKGTLFTNRIFTAPLGYNPHVNISKNGEIERYNLDSDDSFYNSIEYFRKCIEDTQIRNMHYNELRFQAKLFEQFREKAGIEY